MGGLGLLIPLLLAPFTLPQQYGREYKYLPTLKSWNDSRTYCQDKYLGLAVIKTQEEWSRVLEMVADSGHVHVWLGPTLELTAQCVSSHSQLDAHTWACTTLQPFICLTKVNRIFYNRYNVVMQSYGSLDMNDPQVQAALLAQMENRLREQGIEQPLTFEMKKGLNREDLNETLSAGVRADGGPA